MGWKVPETVAVRESAFIREFARYYYDVDSVDGRVARGEDHTFSVSWVRPWISNAFVLAKGKVIIPTALSLVGLAFLAVTLIYHRRSADIPTVALLAFLSPATLLTQSLLLSPSPRFMFVGLWILAAVALSLGLRPYILRSVITRRIALVGIIFFAAFLIGARAHSYFVRHRPATALAVLFNVPGPDHGFYPLPEAKDFIPFVTHSGLIVVHPTIKKLIWNGPLLSTPTPDQRLELRVAGSLRDGFRTAVARTPAVGQ